MAYLRATIAAMVTTTPSSGEVAEGEYERRVAEWRDRVQRAYPDRSAFEQRITEDAYYCGWTDHDFARRRAVPSNTEESP